MTDSESSPDGATCGGIVPPLQHWARPRLTRLHATDAEVVKGAFAADGGFSPS